MNKRFKNAPIVDIDKFDKFDNSDSDRIYLKSNLFVEDAYVLCSFHGTPTDWIEKNHLSYRFIHLKSTQNHSDREGIMIIIDNYII